MKIATWNINSVRLRINLVARFLREHAPDVLCLAGDQGRQRIVSRPKHSTKLGYEHQAINGQKGYHGVACFRAFPSRKPRWRSSAAKAIRAI